MQCDGYVFLDRDPTWFAALLRYVKGDAQCASVMPRASVMELCRELRYYGMNDLSRCAPLASTRASRDVPQGVPGVPSSASHTVHHQNKPQPQALHQQLDMTGRRTTTKLARHGTISPLRCCARESRCGIRHHLRHIACCGHAVSLWLGLGQGLNGRGHRSFTMKCSVSHLVTCEPRRMQWELLHRRINGSRGFRLQSVTSCPSLCVGRSFGVRCSWVCRTLGTNAKRPHCARPVYHLYLQEGETADIHRSRGWFGIAF